MSEDWTHDAELHDWHIIDIPAAKVKAATGKDEPGRIVTGFIYHDSKRRWPDNTRVWTSLVVSLEGDRLTTLNTRYLLVGPAREPE